MTRHGLPKAAANDLLGRFREVISDPINLLIERVPMAGFIEDDQVYLHNGLRVPVAGAGAYYGSFSQLLVLNHGVHEPLEEFVFQEVLKRLPEASSMIELGAHWGHYSMWFLKERPKGHVTLVEPDLNCLKAGENNFARNGFKGEFIRAVVGKGQFEIDDFFRSRKIRQLDVLHTDIQGFEIEMLEGARSVLEQRRVHYLFISTHSQAIHGEVIDRLGNAGYRVEVSSDFDVETTSYDGFVFASSPEVETVFGDIIVLGREEIARRRPADLLKSLDRLLNATGIGLSEPCQQAVDSEVRPDVEHGHVQGPPQRQVQDVIQQKLQQALAFHQTYRSGLHCDARALSGWFGARPHCCTKYEECDRAVVSAQRKLVFGTSQEPERESRF